LLMVSATVRPAAEAVLAELPALASLLQRMSTVAVAPLAAALRPGLTGLQPTELAVLALLALQMVLATALSATETLLVELPALALLAQRTSRAVVTPLAAVLAALWAVLLRCEITNCPVMSLRGSSNQAACCVCKEGKTLAMTELNLVYA